MTACKAYAKWFFNTFCDLHLLTTFCSQHRIDYAECTLVTSNHIPDRFYCLFAAILSCKLNFLILSFLLFQLIRSLFCPPILILSILFPLFLSFSLFFFALLYVEWIAWKYFSREVWIPKVQDPFLFISIKTSSLRCMIFLLSDVHELCAVCRDEPDYLQMLCLSTEWLYVMSATVIIKHMELTSSSFTITF